MSHEWRVFIKLNGFFVVNVEPVANWQCIFGLASRLARGPQLPPLARLFLLNRYLSFFEIHCRLALCDHLIIKKPRLPSLQRTLKYTMADF